MRPWLAIRAFFIVMFNPKIAAEFERILKADEPSPAPEREPEKKAPKAVKPAKTPSRSDAINLLSALQREARFVDIVQEPLGDYSDEQVGAAARDVLRDCGEVLERFFAMKALVDEAEGAELEAPAGYDTGRYRLTGNVSGDPPLRGQLVHHGWQATRCELPQWSGSEQSAMVVAPIELEIN